MAKSARITIATGKSTDAITGVPIPAGEAVAHVEFNSRCAGFLTLASLQRLATEIAAGPGLLFETSHTPAEPQRW